MTQQHNNAPSARGGVTVLCFLIVIIGQIYLLRQQLFSGSLSMGFYPEILFCILMLAGGILCCVQPLGWRNKIGCIASLVLYVFYVIYSVSQYNMFASAYLSGISSEYQSTGGALVGLKLVLVLIGITAGIPVAPKIDDREYARRLREKVQLQDAQRAKETAIHAKEEMDITIERLRATLSEEELNELLEKLQAPRAEEPKKESVAEEWRGWGGGM